MRLPIAKQAEQREERERREGRGEKEARNQREKSERWQIEFASLRGREALSNTQKKKTKNKKREEENKQNSVPKINKYHIVKCETSIGRRGGGEATKKTRPDERTLRE